MTYYHFNNWFTLHSWYFSIKSLCVRSR